MTNPAYYCVRCDTKGVGDACWFCGQSDELTRGLAASASERWRWQRHA